MSEKHLHLPKDPLRPFHPFDRRLVWPVGCALLRVFFRVLGGLKVQGLENVPTTGPVLLISNHLSNCDPVVVQSVVPRLVRFMAKDELFGSQGLARAMEWAYAFTVRRGEPDRKALRIAQELLCRGECVGMFPEGYISQNGELQALKPGIALLARKSGATVVPCRLDETQKVMPYSATTFRRSGVPIGVRFHTPRVFEPDSGTDEILNWATEVLAPSA